MKFCKAVTEERANIVKNIKDVSANLFFDLDIKPTVFSGDKSLKAADLKLATLLKKSGNYTSLAPILFSDPTEILPDDLFKSTILVNVCFSSFPLSLDIYSSVYLFQIAHVLMFGKAILSHKKRGGPKGRGERMGAQTVTEGMIASTATIVSLPTRHSAIHHLMSLIPGQVSAVARLRVFSKGRSDWHHLSE